jgi:transcription termination factor NusB
VKTPCPLCVFIGALQSLLSTLQRAADWPEVEKQISKVISILVTYEDDWALLQRSALIILTALYTLQVKTLTQCKISAKAASDASLGESDGELEIANRSRTASCSSQVTLPSTTTPRWDSRPPGAPMSPPLKTSRSDELRVPASAGIAALSTGAATGIGGTRTKSGKYGETYHGHLNASLDSEVEELLHQQRGQAQVREKAEYMRRLLEEAEEEQENLKALISAAVAKLSLVLASEWGKLASPLGAFGSMGGGAVPGMGPGGAGGFGLGMGGMSHVSFKSCPVPCAIAGDTVETSPCITCSHDFPSLFSPLQCEHPRRVPTPTQHDRPQPARVHGHVPGP